jgi:hypothetical protein
MPDATSHICAYQKISIEVFTCVTDTTRYVYRITNDGKFEPLFAAHIAYNALTVMDTDSMLYLGQVVCPTLLVPIH